MRVYVFPADVTGCGYYRLIWPAEVLKERGHDIRIIHPKNRGSAISATYDTEKKIVLDVKVPEDADVIVFQRVTHMFLAQAIAKMREKGVAVVIDMDDDLSRIDPGNPAFVATHPDRVKRGVSEHSWLACVDACVSATMVQVSTPALLRRYAPHGRGQVIRNCVPARYLRIPHEDSDVIGWGGALRTHPNDVPVLGSSITRLMREGHSFRTIGDTTGIQRVLGLSEEPDAWGPIPLDKYPEAVAQFGVSIAPLADTEFNRSKSWLKPLESAALGVPCVMSPRDEYREIHKLGVGLLAAGQRDWYRQLKRLATDRGLRTEMSARGREIADAWTIEKRAGLWWEVWSEARRLQDAS